ncbi:unnamed protein product [Cladocopium goreaui]|uniref:Uncharacterized protein n=1 Tax=Cladocopium goreaui TaxID=2562237 RepID=A0A9P1FLV8_9DINO|nr:unnamed protein product [Cladocopium goreaui]
MPVECHFEVLDCLSCFFFYLGQGIPLVSLGPAFCSNASVMPQAVLPASPGGRFMAVAKLGTPPLVHTLKAVESCRSFLNQKFACSRKYSWDLCGKSRFRKWAYS